MTNETLRIKVAAFLNYDEEIAKMHRGESYVIPCFTEDLNAMYEAEEKLTEPLRKQYVDELLTDGWNLIHLSALRRAETFVKVMKKQKENR